MSESPGTAPSRPRARRRTRSAGLPEVLACVALLAAGCAGNTLRARARSVRTVIAKARAQGAYHCAPRELALADVNVTFAEGELAQGDYFRAREHVELAEANAAEALRNSPPERCLPRPAAAAEPVPVAPAPAQDRDGDGIPDAQDRCPGEPEDRDGFEDEDGCPDPDNDGDGIPDAQDRCPNEPEDRDGFEDGDGCPDPDNDGDGIPDARDRCPNEPEDRDGFEDEDGCPDPDNDGDGIDDAADKCPNEAGPPLTAGCPQQFKHIAVKKDRIELLQKIFFDSAKARIQPRSYGLLEEVAEALQARPSMRVRIEGHTDAQGKREFNLKLSQQRADAVRAHLMGLGVAPERMEAIGYGPDQPIENNKTAAGRERNRRVEFFITQQ